MNYYNVVILVAFVFVSLFVDFLYTPVTGKELTHGKRFLIFIIVCIVFGLLIFITP